MPQPQIVPQKQFETLEDFANGMNNYPYHFSLDPYIGRTRRNTPHFQRFQEQNQEMEGEMISIVTRTLQTRTRLNRFENLSGEELEKLWGSYKKMSQLVYADDPGVMEYSEPSVYLLS